jgi:hypothetical protein
MTYVVFIIDYIIHLMNESKNQIFACILMTGGCTIQGVHLNYIKWVHVSNSLWYLVILLKNSNMVSSRISSKGNQNTNQQALRHTWSQRHLGTTSPPTTSISLCWSLFIWAWAMKDRNRLIIMFSFPLIRVIYSGAPTPPISTHNDNRVRYVNYGM